jgi:hypothetical protein
MQEVDWRKGTRRREGTIELELGRMELNLESVKELDCAPPNPMEP